MEQIAEDSVDFKLDPSWTAEETLERFHHHLTSRTGHHLGYPYNLHLASAALGPFLRFSINNLGDPFVESNYGVHSRTFEVYVLEFFAKLWKISLDEYWGYVTTCGTEGNLHGILVAREVLPDGVLYASVESHYSVFKAARYYRMDAKPIPTTYSGELDYDVLEEELKKGIDRPAIINCNVGTTVKGAVDDVQRVIDVLKKVGYTRDRFYIHCDGALFALMLPFVKTDERVVNFEMEIDSMSVSGHKFLGCPMPCGVIIHWKRNVTKVEQSIEYLNSVDCTIMGSRNGQAPLAMWYRLVEKSLADFSRDVELCMENSRHLVQLLENHKISCMLNKLSNTVVLSKPPCDEFIRKWQLACKGGIAHVVVMQNVSKQKLETFVEELVVVREACKASGLEVDGCVKQQIGPHCSCSACKE